MRVIINIISTIILSLFAVVIVVHAAAIDYNHVVEVARRGPPDP